eukprot:scaffold227762_cov46-Attheya_sp.AAC.1
MSGCLRPDNALEENAMEIIFQSARDMTLIPLWDMINHDSSDHCLNTKQGLVYPTTIGEGMKVWVSSRPIATGEEIYVTYDECIGCPHNEFHFDTLQILRNFGFVERYSQRWVFPDLDIWFEIDEQTIIDNGQQQKQQLQADFGDPPHIWKPKATRS